LESGKFFAFYLAAFHLRRMTEPLVLVLYEKLLPGTQLVNRLQDLHYRVQAVTEAETLVACARQDKPLAILADLFSTRGSVSEAIGQLKQSAETQHIPIIAFAEEQAVALQEAARAAGAVVVVNEGALLDYLPQFLEEALRVE
jgi:CheY-like chemotaxis protein